LSEEEGHLIRISSAMKLPYSSLLGTGLPWI